MTIKTRAPQGRFKKGTSGNPSGRPPGSRNKSTIAAEQLLEGEAEHIMRKVIDLAKQGNLAAIRLCLERQVPVKKDRAITLELKPIESAADLPAAFQDIMAAVANGSITPVEGECLNNMLTNHARALQSVELEGRLQALEQLAQEVTQYWKEMRGIIEGGVK